MSIDNFWTEQADALRSCLASQGREFVANASLEEIEVLAGPEFLAQNEKAKLCIIAVMRSTGASNAPSL